MLQLQLHQVHKLNQESLQIITNVVMYMQKLERKHIRLDDYVLLLVKPTGFPLCGFALLRKNVSQKRQFQLIHIIATSTKFTRVLHNAVDQFISQTRTTSVRNATQRLRWSRLGIGTCCLLILLCLPILSMDVFSNYDGDYHSDGD